MSLPVILLQFNHFIITSYILINLEMSTLRAVRFCLHLGLHLALIYRSKVRNEKAQAPDSPSI